MSDLADLVEGLKREVAVPGEFATTFPNTTDDDLVGSLADAFAQCQLDGFFGDQTLDLNTNVVSPDLSAGGAALVAIYASERILMSKMRSMPTRTVYKAGGGAEYEKDMSANVLTQQLKMMQARKEAILAQALRIQRAARGTYMLDSYLIRSTSPWYGNFALEVGMWGGFFDYELAQVSW